MVTLNYHSTSPTARRTRAVNFWRHATLLGAITLVVTFLACCFILQPLLERP